MDGRSSKTNGNGKSHEHPANGAGHAKTNGTKHETPRTQLITELNESLGIISMALFHGFTDGMKGGLPDVLPEFIDPEVKAKLEANTDFVSKRKAFTSLYNKLNDVPEFTRTSSQTSVHVQPKNEDELLLERINAYFESCYTDENIEKAQITERKKGLLAAFISLNADIQKILFSLKRFERENHDPESFEQKINSASHNASRFLGNSANELALNPAQINVAALDKNWLTVTEAMEKISSSKAHQTSQASNITASIERANKTAQEQLDSFKRETNHLYGIAETQFKVLRDLKTSKEVNKEGIEARYEKLKAEIESIAKQLASLKKIRDKGISTPSAAEFARDFISGEALNKKYDDCVLQLRGLKEEYKNHSKSLTVFKNTTSADLQSLITRMEQSKVAYSSFCAVNIGQLDTANVTLSATYGNYAVEIDGIATKIGDPSNPNSLIARMKQHIDYFPNQEAVIACNKSLIRIRELATSLSLMRDQVEAQCAKQSSVWNFRDGGAARWEKIGITIKSVLNRIIDQTGAYVGVDRKLNGSWTSIVGFADTAKTRNTYLTLCANYEVLTSILKLVLSQQATYSKFADHQKKLSEKLKKGSTAIETQFQTEIEAITSDIERIFNDELFSDKAEKADHLKLAALESQLQDLKPVVNEKAKKRYDAVKSIVLQKQQEKDEAERKLKADQEAYETKLRDFDMLQGTHVRSVAEVKRNAERVNDVALQACISAAEELLLQSLAAKDKIIGTQSLAAKDKIIGTALGLQEAANTKILESKAKYRTLLDAEQKKLCEEKILAAKEDLKAIPSKFHQHSDLSVDIKSAKSHLGEANRAYTETYYDNASEAATAAAEAADRARTAYTKMHQVRQAPIGEGVATSSSAPKLQTDIRERSNSNGELSTLERLPHRNASNKSGGQNSDGGGGDPDDNPANTSPAGVNGRRAVSKPGFWGSIGRFFKNNWKPILLCAGLGAVVAGLAVAGVFTFGLAPALFGIAAGVAVGFGVPTGVAATAVTIGAAVVAGAVAGTVIGTAVAAVVECCGPRDTKKRTRPVVDEPKHNGSKRRELGDEDHERLDRPQNGFGSDLLVRERFAASDSKRSPSPERRASTSDGTVVSPGTKDVQLRNVAGSLEGTPVGTPVGTPSVAKLHLHAQPKAPSFSLTGSDGFDKLAEKENDTRSLLKKSG